MKNWLDYWARKSSPQHARETETDYRALAGELRLLYADVPTDRVLEIGCGNGALFTHLGFHKANTYRGIDFSESMLAEFADHHPDVQLEAADAADFRSTQEFDLVFSSHVAQYWDKKQLARHVSNARSMITDNGQIVVAGVPWSRMRLAFARGDLSGGDLIGGPRRSLPTTLVAAVREILLPDIGYWYDLPELTELATILDLTATFRGSAHYPYRFHAIFRPHSSSRGG